MKPLRPGTSAHEQAIGRAIGMYLDGHSLETSARANRVNHQTLRTRLLKSGLKPRSLKGQNYRSPIKINQRQYEIILAEHPRLSVREISNITGVSKTTVTKHLKQRGTYQPRPKGPQPETQWAVSLRNRTKILRAVELRQTGLTYGQIAIRLGVTKSTVGTWLRQYKTGSFKWQREPIPPGMWHEG
jgi:transposase